LGGERFDFVYCAGLFDYLSDKMCERLLRYFASCTNPGGLMLATNVHSCNPGKLGMAHLLEWHLIYRDEAQLAGLLPSSRGEASLYVDASRVNVFAEFRVPSTDLV
jgi:extracellular factor (EF) 3-hydroxypalmitic acid methyl ester biosynthesis protein